MKKTTTWKTGRGTDVVVTIEMVTEREIDVDGDKRAASVCDLVIIGRNDGQYMGSEVERMTAIESNGVIFTGRIGALGIPEAKMTEIESAITEIKASAEWQHKLSAKRQSDIDADDIAAHQHSMRKHMSE